MRPLNTNRGFSVERPAGERVENPIRPLLIILDLLEDRKPKPCFVHPEPLERIPEMFEDRVDRMADHPGAHPFKMDSPHKPQPILMFCEQDDHCGSVRQTKVS